MKRASGETRRCSLSKANSWGFGLQSALENAMQGMERETGWLFCGPWQRGRRPQGAVGLRSATSCTPAGRNAWRFHRDRPSHRARVRCVKTVQHNRSRRLIEPAMWDRLFNAVSNRDRVPVPNGGGFRDPRLRACLDAPAFGAANVCVHLVHNAHPARHNPFR